jgi:hypothetical protein
MIAHGPAVTYPAGDKHTGCLLCVNSIITTVQRKKIKELRELGYSFLCPVRFQ